MHRRDRVYITTDKAAALVFAASWPDGVVYECEPVGAIEPDPDCKAPGLAYQCERARIVQCLKPSSESLKMARACAVRGCGMKDRPVLFSAPMVRAILSGAKTQTRRALKGKPLALIAESGFSPDFIAHPENALCPYGQPGDRLWVRETFAHIYRDNSKPDARRDDDVAYKADHPGLDEYAYGSWKPSIHMPRWASRITLEITGVRVEMLKSISSDDAYAEGAAEWAAETVRDGNKYPSAVAAFQALWEQINGPESWAANHWVWCVRILSEWRPDMTQENKQAEQGDAKALLAMRKLMGAVNAYEKATGIGGWYAEEVQTWVNSLARHLGIDVAFGCGAEYPVSLRPIRPGLPQPEAQPTLCERICTAIREADSKSVDEAGYMLDSNDCIRIVREQFAAPSAQAPQPEAQPHADDIAVDAFAEAMKQKLAAARDKGRHGWQECSQADLNRNAA